MEKLFDDLQCFQKERPTDLTNSQKEEFYYSLAKEIKENNWSDDSIECIIHDLKELSMHDSGYEMAKDLEGYRMSANYNIDTDFIYWLDDFHFKYSRVLDENVAMWVKAHNPQPKYEIGQKLIIESTLNYKQKKGDIVYVNGINKEKAYYLVDADKNKKGGIILNYEILESNTTELKD